MKKIVYLISVFAVCLLSAGKPAYAKLEITPSVTVGGEYNDNIYLTETDREDDFITKISPAISLKYAIQPLDLSLDYSLNFKFYGNHSDLNENSIGEMQAVRFINQYRPFKFLFIDLSDIYKRVPVDVRRPVALDNTVVNMTESNTFSVSPYVILPLTSTTSITTGYAYKNKWYKDEESVDFDSHSVFLALNKRFSAKISGALKSDYFAYRPKLTNGYDRYEGSAALRYQISSNFSTWGEIGRAYLDFSDSANEETTFWDAGSEYKLNILGGSFIGVSYSSYFSESEGIVAQQKYLYDADVYPCDPQDPKCVKIGTVPVYTTENKTTTIGAAKTKTLAFYVTAEQPLKTTVRSYYSVEEELLSAREDEIKGVSVSISKNLSPRMSVSLDSKLENQKFFPGTEKTWLYSIGGGLDYKLSRMITAGIGYRYHDRNSNIDSNDFHNNSFWVKSDVTF
ncbi:MAG: TIGR03016 family PEP-CTERM system-associated outer membrane protein [Nitrospirota bacterium]